VVDPSYLVCRGNGRRKTVLSVRPCCRHPRNFADGDVHETLLPVTPDLEPAVLPFDLKQIFI